LSADWPSDMVLDNFDYRCGAIAASFQGKSTVIKERVLAEDAKKAPS